MERTDASLILLSQKTEEKLLSNDYTLMLLGRSKGIECWWLTTLILKMVKEKAINQEKAKQILFHLITVGMRLKPEVYATILNHIQKMT